LFPVRALSVVFRAKFRDGLQQLFDEHQLQFPKAQPNWGQPVAWARWLRRTCRRKWVVYTKQPFAGPQTVLAYLCRYTHRVAITNGRLEALDRQNDTVTFAYKDYAHDDQRRSMTLPLHEFLRRFCLHILPLRFVKIRHYGLLANRNRPARIAHARDLLAQLPQPPHQGPAQDLTLKHVERPPLLCPYCGRDTLVLIRIVDPSETPPFDDSS
jgi:hypothetical protein